VKPSGFDTQAGFARRRALAWVAGALAGMAVVFVLLRPRPDPPPAGVLPGSIPQDPHPHTVHSDRPLEELYPELVEIGSWMREFVNPKTVIYAGEPVSAAAAGAVYRPLPPGPYEETLDTVVREEGDFVILHQQVAAATSPALAPLTNDKSVAYYDARLAVVKVIPNPARNTIVFRVLRPGGPDSVRTERVSMAFSRFMDHGDNHVWHGSLALRKERWSSAANEFGYALKTDSTNAALHNNRAWALLKADLRMDLAEKHARAAVAADPDNPDFLDTLVRVLEAVGKPAEAETFRKRLASLEGGP
jgi:hypothetical protein